MLAQSAQTSFHRKITYTILSRSACANIAQENYLCDVYSQPMNTFAQENNLQCCLAQTFFCRKINYTLLSWSASIRKTVTCTMQKMFTHSPQSSQCFPNTVETTLHKKITGAILVQSAQIYFLRKIGYFKYVSWPVLTGFDTTKQSCLFLVNFGLGVHLQLVGQQWTGPDIDWNISIKIRIVCSSGKIYAEPVE